VKKNKEKNISTCIKVPDLLQLVRDGSLFKESVVSPGKNFSNGSKFPRAGEIFCVKTPPP
jgi:hypothetical protein